MRSAFLFVCLLTFAKTHTGFLFFFPQTHTHTLTHTFFHEVLLVAEPDTPVWNEAVFVFSSTEEVGGAL